MENKYIKSPLNYTGGKYKLLKDIISRFPKNIDTFVDLFAGGFNVGVNVEANSIYANDHIVYLVEMFNYFQKQSIGDLIESIKNVIVKYKLDKENVEGYNKLRKDYNANPSPLLLFILTCYSFNHQIRFNNSFEFNTPFGKYRSSYNSSIENNLISFCSRLHDKNIIFSNYDFRNFNYEVLNKNDVIYCDPPYLITTGSYNDGKRGFGDWTEKEDLELMNILDNLNNKGVIFYLSNVFYHKGISNDALIEWSKKYNVIYLDKDYSNCSYHFKDRDAKTVEVLITNMEVVNE